MCIIFCFHKPLLHVYNILFPQGTATCVQYSISTRHCHMCIIFSFHKSLPHVYNNLFPYGIATCVQYSISTRHGHMCIIFCFHKALPHVYNFYFHMSLPCLNILFPQGTATCVQCSIFTWHVILVIGGQSLQRDHQTKPLLVLLIRLDRKRDHMHSQVHTHIQVGECMLCVIL